MVTMTMMVLRALGDGAYQNYTAYWTRWLVDNAYTLDAAGIPGNDDFGTLSSWLLWAMVGLYPLAGTSTFIIGAPRFEFLRIARGGTGSGGSAGIKDLCVIAYNVSVPSNIYVQKVELEGMPLNKPFVDFAALGGGGAGGDDGNSGNAGGSGGGGRGGATDRTRSGDSSTHGSRVDNCVTLVFYMGADDAGPWHS